jgi:nicotinamide-nucleotide amidase
MDRLKTRAAAIMELAKTARVTLAVAESCTAGALSVLLADAPGAAERFHGGFVVYTKENKTAALGVPPSLIAARTAVSPDVAKAMASGVLDRSPAEIAVAITGVAGPEPDEDGNPVGLVYVGVAARGAVSQAVECKFGDRSREEIRELSLECALELVEWVVKGRLAAHGVGLPARNQ